jgi:hypothetical protein
VLPNAPRLAAVAAVTPAELEQTALELEAEADNNPAWLQEAAP